MRTRPKLGQLLVHAGAINSEQLSAALGEQRQFPGRLGTTLVRMGYLNEETLVRTLARQLKLPIAWLRGKRVSYDVLDVVPKELAEKYGCLPLLVHVEGGVQVLCLAMADPSDLAVVDDLSFRLGIKVKPVLVAPSELDDAIRRHYHQIPVPGPSVDWQDPSEVTPLDGPDLIVLDRAVTGMPPEPVRESDVVFEDFTDSAPLRAEADAGEPYGEPATGKTPVKPVQVLQALTQLLVEKGVLEREELIARLGRIADSDGDDTDY